MKWCRKKDLNPQPTDYKSVALPIELLRRDHYHSKTCILIINILNNGLII